MIEDELCELTAGSCALLKIPKMWSLRPGDLPARTRSLWSWRAAMAVDEAIAAASSRQRVHTQHIFNLH
jgi:hypothetical protein